MCLFEVEFSFFPDICPGVGLLDHMVTLFLAFKGIFTCSPGQPHQDIGMLPLARHGSVQMCPPPKMIRSPRGWPGVTTGALGVGQAWPAPFYLRVSGSACDHLLCSRGIFSQPLATLRPGSGRSGVERCSDLSVPTEELSATSPLTQPEPAHYSPCLILTWPSAATGWILTHVNSYQCDSVPAGQSEPAQGGSQSARAGTM